MPDGSVRAVQMKDVDLLSGIDWSGAIKTELSKRRPDMWLENGDILFAARGINNYAVVATGCPPKAVVSPHFFHLRVKSDAQLLPEFLAWQINQAPAQKYFRKFSEGSAVVGIRKSVLSELPVLAPSIEEQRKVVDMIECWKKQRVAIEMLSENHNQLMAAIANKVLNNQSDGEEG